MNVALPTNDPELLEQIDGNLEDADAPASLVYASACRSFQEASELLSRVKSATGYFPVVGIGAFDGSPQPSTDRKPAKTGDKERERRKTSQYKGEQSPNLGRPEVLAKTPSRSEPRPPMSKKRPTEPSTTRRGPHHTPRLRPHQCMLCHQVGYHALECPNEGTTMSLSPGKRAFGTCALGRALLNAM